MNYINWNKSLSEINLRISFLVQPAQAGSETLSDKIFIKSPHSAIDKQNNNVIISIRIS